MIEEGWIWEGVWYWCCLDCGIVTLLLRVGEVVVAEVCFCFREGFSLCLLGYITTQKL